MSERNLIRDLRDLAPYTKLSYKAADAIEQQAATIERLAAERDALWADAERYRRLRNRGRDMSVHIAILTESGGYCPTGEECDAAIDAAMKEKP